MLPPGVPVTVDAPLSAVTSEVKGRNGLDIVLEHDFGVVRPGQTFTHAFTIHNPSGRPWTLKSVLSSCSCSLVRAGAERIEAMGDERFEFSYRSPDKPSNERRWVTLHFDGLDVPVHLVIRAHVRPEMTIEPTFLHIGRLRVGDAGLRTIQLDDFGNRDWSSVDLASPPSWLRVLAVSLADHPKSAPEPRQRWLIEVRADSGGLRPGVYQTRARIRALAHGDVQELALPVRMDVVDAVALSPSVLMFGTVVPNREAKSNVLLTFLEGPPGCSPEDVTAKLSGIRDYRLKWNAVSSTQWRLSVGIRLAAGGERFVSDTLVLGFPKGTMRDVAIPLHAKVEDHEHN